MTVKARSTASPETTSRDTTPRETTPRSPRSEQELLSTSALAVFRLNGQMLDLAERLARPVGLTAAWWQVLGAVLAEPSSVAGIARQMGITRQSVQRIADLLVDRGLAEYLPNPAHRTAKLLGPTAAGRAAVHRLNPAHAASAKQLTAVLGHSDFESICNALAVLSAALDTLDTPTPQTRFK